MKRFLAIDLGTKRTGLAIGDDQVGIPMPIDVIQVRDESSHLEAIGRAIDEQGADELVLGLPLNMDGTEGPASVAARAFARRLEERFDLPVHLVDERLTSEAAGSKLQNRGLSSSKRKARLDALAAATILQDFLDRR